MDKYLFSLFCVCLFFSIQTMDKKSVVDSDGEEFYSCEEPSSYESDSDNEQALIDKLLEIPQNTKTIVIIKSKKQ